MERYVEVARWKLGLTPGLPKKEILETVGERLGLTDERVRQKEEELLSALRHALALRGSMVGRCGERVRAWLTSGAEAIPTAAGLCEALRGDYPWMRSEGDVLPLLRLLRIWEPAWPLGWGADAKGCFHVWWDLRATFGTAWERLGGFVRELIDGKAKTDTTRRRPDIARWCIEQEKTPEWPRIRLLAEVLGGLPGMSAEDHAEAWETLRLDNPGPKNDFKLTLQRIGKKLGNNERTAARRKMQVVEALRTSGAMNADEIAQATGIEPNLVRSTLYALEREKTIQMVGNTRYALAMRLPPGLVREVTAFLRQQFARGGVRCGFIHQAYLAFRGQLPEGCTPKRFFAALRHDPAFELCASVYPCVSTCSDLRSRGDKEYGAPFWKHLNARLSRELPIPSERMSEIWDSWFGGDPVQMPDKLTKAFGLRTYKSEGKRWYDRPSEVSGSFTDGDMEAARSFEEALGARPLDFREGATQIPLLEGMVGKAFTPAVRAALQTRMFERRDGLWQTLASVMPEDDQRALARQCAAWLDEWPIVTVARLAEGHPGMDARCLRRVFERHAPGRIDVREELCIRPGRPMYESEEQMARSVVEELRRSGGAQAIAKLTARFPNVDAEWLTIRFPELCGKLGVACVTEGNAVLIPPDEVPGDVAGALGEDPAERHFADVAAAVAESCGERSPEAFLNIYFQDSAALFRRFAELEDPHERTWRGEVLGASNLSLSDLAAKLRQPFTFEEFGAAGRRLCGWTRDGNRTALARVCLRLDEDLWMTPAAFRAAVGWDDGLAARIAARLRMFHRGCAGFHRRRGARAHDAHGGAPQARGRLFR